MAEQELTLVEVSRAGAHIIGASETPSESDGGAGGRAVADQGGRLPRDKSLTHRAIIFAALAEGSSTIHEPLLGEDCLATAGIMRALGISVTLHSDHIVIEGTGIAPKTTGATLDCGTLSCGTLSCGNSGTTARLLLGLFSGIDGFRGTLTGDASLSARPMARVTKLIDPDETGQFAPYDTLPITVHGQRPKPRSFHFAKASGQVKSALLLHSLDCAGTVDIRLPAGGRDHTEQMLRHQGADLSVTRDGSDEVIRFKGPFRPKPGQWRIPLDPSSLAFLWVAILTTGAKERRYGEVLANPTRIGGLKVLARMAKGFVLEPETKSFDRVGEPLEPTVAVTCPAGVALTATDVRDEELPTLIDEIPILAVAACFAEGTSRFSGLAELRVKESDRLAETERLLASAGAQVTIEGDDLLVTGSHGFVPSPFRYEAHGDHRMVMAAIVLALSCPEPCTIGNYRAVATSFPDFLTILRAATAHSPA